MKFVLVSSLFLIIGSFAYVVVVAEEVSDTDEFVKQEISKNSTEWSPELGEMINIPVESCDTKDSLNQTSFAQLMYLNMFPQCEETYKTGYCGIRLVYLLSKKSFI